ncbi:NUDIX hydrolase [Kitasatospora viridis]|uniref:8-oxo-dGTP diphosphatase n=1 Tax=Kitasatospora viridis TaxID=281105 RepID=A0A561UMR5_9ACTN|nr:NUDIX domain-containing protein [Kitasatospora viridis]TWG00665.1 8-oxo-dGTP diphosphatase [Kitasatospora viridis]
MTSSPELASPPEDRYPALFAPQRWEWGGMDARFALALPPDELITNIHLIGFAGDRVVLCEDDRGFWFLPGGTREQDEPVLDCLVRELAEEAGARLAGEPVWIGAHRAVTDRAEPYRPWQPHPEKAWLWGWAEVVVDGAPLNPVDGEQVVQVRAMPVEEAAERLGYEPWRAELVRLAAELRETAGPRGA